MKVKRCCRSIWKQSWSEKKVTGHLFGSVITFLWYIQSQSRHSPVLIRSCCRWVLTTTLADITGAADDDFPLPGRFSSLMLLGLFEKHSLNSRTPAIMCSHAAVASLYLSLLFTFRSWYKCKKAKQKNETKTSEFDDKVLPRCCSLQEGEETVFHSMSEGEELESSAT